MNSMEHPFHREIKSDDKSEIIFLRNTCYVLSGKFKLQTARVKKIIEIDTNPIHITYHIQAALHKMYMTNKDDAETNFGIFKLETRVSFADRGLILIPARAEKYDVLIDINTRIALNDRIIYRYLKNISARERNGMAA